MNQGEGAEANDEAGSADDSQTVEPSEGEKEDTLTDDDKEDSETGDTLDEENVSLKSSVGSKSESSSNGSLKEAEIKRNNAAATAATAEEETKGSDFSVNIEAFGRASILLGECHLS